MRCLHTGSDEAAEHKIRAQLGANWQNKKQTTPTMLPNMTNTLHPFRQASRLANNTIMSRVSRPNMLTWQHTRKHVCAPSTHRQSYETQVPVSTPDKCVMHPHGVNRVPCENGKPDNLAWLHLVLEASLSWKAASHESPSRKFTRHQPGPRPAAAAVGRVPLVRYALPG